ncbi:hypothetical protein IRJ41_021183, partial [Triplophysa rosa]
AQDYTRAQQRPSAEPKLTELFACFCCSFPKGPSTCSHSGAWAINKSPARRSALLILKGYKDFGAQPTYLEQKVIRRTRNPQAQSNLRVLRNSRRKAIRKEMTPKSKEESRRERSNNFQAFVKLALETPGPLSTQTWRSPGYTGLRFAPPTQPIENNHLRIARQSSAQASVATVCHICVFSRGSQV